MPKVIKVCNYKKTLAMIKENIHFQLVILVLSLGLQRLGFHEINNYN